MKKNFDVVNAYRVLLLTGIVCQASVANAQFGGVGGLLNKKLNQLQAATNQPPTAVSDQAAMNQPPAAVSDQAVTNQPPAAVSEPAQSTSPTPDASGNKPAENAETPGETQKDQGSASAKATEPSVYTQPIELKNAMYGIPLGASVDEIRKWCEEKNALIDGKTKEDIDEACRMVVTQAKSYGLPGIDIGEKEDIQYDKIEQNLDKASKFNENNSGGANLSPYIEALRTICKGVKNPTVSYKGKIFILPSVESLEPANAYILAIKPSEEMKSDGIKVIEILLKKKGDGLVSYGAAVVCERSEFSKIAQALNEKYGDGQKVERSENLFRLTSLSAFNKDNYSREIYQWRKNILMAGNTGGSFNDVVALYYDVDAASQLVAEQDASLQEMADKQKLEEQKRQEKLKDNF